MKVKLKLSDDRNFKVGDYVINNDNLYKITALDKDTGAVWLYNADINCTITYTEFITKVDVKFYPFKSFIATRGPCIGQAMIAEHRNINHHCPAEIRAMPKEYANGTFFRASIGIRKILSITLPTIESAHDWLEFQYVRMLVYGLQSPY